MELFAFICLFSKMKIQVVPNLYEFLSFFFYVEDEEDILMNAGNHW